jgi:hypothetical protein
MISENMCDVDGRAMRAPATAPGIKCVTRDFFDEHKEYDIGKYFDRKIIILINVSDDLLTNNINDRKSRGATGDYLKVDMFAMKNNIEKRFNVHLLSCLLFAFLFRVCTHYFCIQAGMIFRCTLSHYTHIIVLHFCFCHF